MLRAPAETDSAWPSGRSPLELLQDLLEKNIVLAETRHFEAIRAKAERQVEESPPEQTSTWEGQGRPLYARRDGGESAQVLTLTRTELDQRQKTWTFTWVWLPFLLLVGAFVAFRPAQRAPCWGFSGCGADRPCRLVGMVGSGRTWIVIGLLLLAVGAQVAGSLWLESLGSSVNLRRTSRTRRPAPAGDIAARREVPRRSVFKPLTTRGSLKAFSSSFSFKSFLRQLSRDL